MAFTVQTTCLRAFAASNAWRVPKYPSMISLPSTGPHLLSSLGKRLVATHVVDAQGISPGCYEPVWQAV